MTWKLSPTYDLASIKAAFNDGDKHDVTSTAAKSAAALGFVRADIVETIQRMERVHFYKSMTSYEDHRVWQDVYHVPSYVGTLCVKFTRDAETGEFLLLSFKEKNND